MNGPLPGRRVLLLGATGFIGGRVARALATSGATLVLHAGRRPAGPTHPAAQWVEADLTVPGAVRPLLETAQADVVINAVGYGVDRNERDEALSRRLNTDLVGELVDALSGLPTPHDSAGPRLVQIGSAFEYGSLQGVVHETGDCRPQSLYAATKLEGTRLVEQAHVGGLPAVTARVPTVYGPGEHPHRLLPSLLRLRETADPLPLTGGEQERDFVFVDDVAEGLIRLASTRPRWGVVNLATGRLHTVRDFVLAVLDVIGLPPGRVIFGAIPYRPDEVRHGPLSVERLREMLDWVPPTDVRTGARHTAEVMRHSILPPSGAPDAA